MNDCLYLAPWCLLIGCLLRRINTVKVWRMVSQPIPYFILTPTLVQSQAASLTVRFNHGKTPISLTTRTFKEPEPHGACGPSCGSFISVSLCSYKLAASSLCLSSRCFTTLTEMWLFSSYLPHPPGWPNNNRVTCLSVPKDTWGWSGGGVEWGYLDIHNYGI